MEKKIMARPKGKATKDDIVWLRHWLNIIGRRLVPYVCSSYDEEKFLHWQMNCCRQTAMVVHGFLNKPEIVTQHNIRNPRIYEGHFEDPVFGPYDHAYNKVDLNVRDTMLIDVATVSFKPLTMINVTSELAMLRSVEVGHTIKHIKTVELNYKELNREREYYTDLPGKEFVELCLSYLKRWQK